ncbi:MAG: hypothetical protein DLM59_12060 [Pseudonocardiales bacterium]|nr:MAG: hypothetical protein DLM59_12060 [Pseudonocardiales bacterium]
MVSGLRAVAGTGRVMPPVDDLRVLYTDLRGHIDSVMFHRVKQGVPLIYAFTWGLDIRGGVLTREVTVTLPHPADHLLMRNSTTSPSDMT